jgi:F1F0 ATPase subunit 2
MTVTGVNELSIALLALAAGVALGAFYFGGLWWTVVRGVAARHAALWFFASLLLRTGVAMFGFYLVAHGSWQRLLVCLCGFAMARLIVTRCTALAAPRPASTHGASHAP